MNSYFERQISRLRDGQFGPLDPRTPSVASVPGRQLSFDNQIKNLEYQRRSLDYIQESEQRSQEALHAYWSDETHLAQKLNDTIQAIAVHHNKPPEDIARDLAIVKGTGQVVIQEGERYHYVEINVLDKQNPVYIYLKPIVPESQISLLTTAAQLDMHS